MVHSHPQKESSCVVNKSIMLSVQPISDPKPSKKSSRHGLHETSSWNQLKTLLRRGYIMAKRDQVCTFILKSVCFSHVLQHFDHGLWQLRILYNHCTNTAKIGAKFDPLKYKFDMDAKPLQLTSKGPHYNANVLI
jgi:hypothetical protein